MNTLNFAIVGCGAIAPTHADALRELGPDVARLVACADSDPSTAKTFAARFGIPAAPYSDILCDPNINAVIVCAPSGLHASLGIQALRAGKHVVVEKPMDISREACDQLSSVATATGRTLAVISQHRFDAASAIVKQKVDSDALGKLILVDARIAWFRTQEYYDSGDWRGTWELDGGGCLMNQGIHTVDLMLWICGPVVSVTAHTATSAHANIEVEDVVVAALQFANGALGTLVASTATYPGFPARLAVYGSLGSAIIEGDELLTLAVAGQTQQNSTSANQHAVQVATGGTKSATEHKETSALPGGPKWGDAHRSQLMDFIRACNTGTSPLVDGKEGSKAVDLILAVYESSRIKATVRLDRKAS